jgi:hypothetical protein
MLCEEISNTTAGYKSNVHRTSAENRIELGPPNGQSRYICGTNQYEKSQDESFAGTPQARVGHETGSARSMSCMPNARMPMLSVPIELRLQTAPKLKPMSDRRACGNETFKVSGNADHIWQMEVDRKL